MKKILTIIVVTFVMGSTFFVLFMASWAIGEMFHCNAWYRVLLLIPITFVTICYEMGVIVLLDKFFHVYPKNII